jgi:hypothetical protein
MYPLAGDMCALKVLFPWRRSDKSSASHQVALLSLAANHEFTEARVEQQEVSGCNVAEAAAHGENVLVGHEAVHHADDNLADGGFGTSGGTDYWTVKNSWCKLGHGWIHLDPEGQQQVWHSKWSPIISHVSASMEV